MADIIYVVFWMGILIAFETVSARNLEHCHFAAFDNVTTVVHIIIVLKMPLSLNVQWNSLTSMDCLG